MTRCTQVFLRWPTPAVRCQVSPHTREPLAQQFRVDEETFLLGQRFLQTRHAIAGMLFDQPTQYRTQRLVFLTQALVWLLAVVIGLLADPHELTDLVHARFSLRYQRSRVLSELPARGA